MSQHSPIQWCDSTVNPVMGCDGCELWQRPELPNARRSCFAGVQHQFRGGNPGWAKRFEVVEQFPGRMAQAARWSDLTGHPRADKPWLHHLPRVIFISDMGDALSKAVPFEFLLHEIIRHVSSPAGSRHRWLWLTKQPKRMAKFSEWLRELGVEWPPNLWAGASLTMRGNADLRISWLLDVGDERTQHFLSIEPQVAHHGHELKSWDVRLKGKIAWIIQGGESGKDARPFALTWAAAMQTFAQDIGAKYFLKQLGRNAVLYPGPRAPALQLRDPHGGDWEEWPIPLRIREVPGVEYSHSRHYQLRDIEMIAARRAS